jgi:hypothetical protein
MKKKQVEIELKDSVTAAVETVNRSLDILEKKLDTTKSSGEKFKEKMKDVGKDITDAFISFKPGEFLKGCTEEFMEAQKSAEQLSLAVSKRGGLGSDLEALQKQAEELQKKGIFGAGETLKLDQLGLQMGLTIKGVQQLTPLIEDVAAATNQSTQSVLEDVIKTANGSEEGLASYGLRIEDTGSKTQNLGNIVDALTQKYHDANETIATTTDAGRVAQLTNDWGDFKEQIGASLLDILHQLMPLLKSGMQLLKGVAGWMKENKAIISGVGVALLGMWTGFKLIQGVKFIMAGLGVAMDAFAIETGVATGTVTAFGMALNVTPIGLFVTALGLIIAAFVGVSNSANDAKEAKDKFFTKSKDEEDEQVIIPLRTAYEAQVARDTLKYKGDEQKKHLEEDKNNYATALQDAKNKHLKEITEVTGTASQPAWENTYTFTNSLSPNTNLPAPPKNTQTPVYTEEITGKVGELSARNDVIDTELNRIGAGTKPAPSGYFENDDTGKKSPDTITKPVEGQKIQTFNITIGDLIKDFTISTTNLSEAPAKVREIIVQALLSAVNDSQISTAH